MTLDTQMTLALLQELLLALRANDPDAFKAWLFLGIERLGKPAVIELMLDGLNPILTTNEADRLVCWQLEMCDRGGWLWRRSSLVMRSSFVSRVESLGEHDAAVLSRRQQYTTASKDALSIKVMKKWNFVDESDLQNWTVGLVCLSCQYFSYGIDQHCHTMVGCNLRQKQLHQGRHLKKRRKLWALT